MKLIAVIPAYNDENTIGNVILKTKKFVDKIIVIDDGSADETSTIASLAGADVIKTDINLGLSHALHIGFEKALEFKPDFVIALYGDFSHNPENIPKLLAPIKEGKSDISIAEPSHDFFAYSFDALQKLVKAWDVSDFSSNKYLNLIEKKFRVDKFFNIRGRYTPLGRYEEHVVDKVKRLTTQKDIYNTKRNIQKELSRIESCKLISETFLKFIPPALLSLIISATFIIPATKIIDIDLTYIFILIISIIVIFIVCWFLLIIFLDKIYAKTEYIEALDRRLDEVELRKT